MSCAAAKALGTYLSILLLAFALSINALTSASAQEAQPEARKPRTPFARMRIAPGHLGFKRVVFGRTTTAQSKTFSIRDVGTAALNVTVGSANIPEFTITQGGGQTVLQPKGSPLLVTVLFAPGAAGVFNDTISVVSDATKGKTDALVKLRGAAKGTPPTPTPSPTATGTPTPTPTPVAPTATLTPTSTSTIIATPTLTATVTPTPTVIATATAIMTATGTATVTATATSSAAATSTPTATPTMAATPSQAPTPGSTATSAMTKTATPTPSSTPTPSGAFFGGNVTVDGTPVAGAAVTFYSVGATGYGSQGSSLGTAITAGNGAYTVPYVCPSGSIETYVVAIGGDAGAGTNSALGLIAPIGPCGNINTSTIVIIDELTTAAAEVALAQFVDSTGQIIGASATNAGGLGVGYRNYYNLAAVDAAGDASVSGVASNFLPSSVQCASGSPPVNCDGLQRLNTLSNIIAACASSSGPNSSPCDALFTNTSTSASDTTLAAMHAMATNPTLNVSSLFAIQAMISPLPYQPALMAGPDGFEIGLMLAVGNDPLNINTALAIDSGGNLFVVGVDSTVPTASINQITPAGGYAVSATLPAGITVADGASIAIDTMNNLFVSSRDSNAVSELTAESNHLDGSVFNPGGAAAFDHPQSVALDAAGNVFVANHPGGGSGSVSELVALGDYSTAFNFTSSDASLTCPASLVVDLASNIFVANCDNTVSKLNAASNYSSGFEFYADRSGQLDGGIGVFHRAGCRFQCAGAARGHGQRRHK